MNAAYEEEKTDWGKIAMGIAVAIVFIMQQYHSMKLNDLKVEIVPRPEFEMHQATLMQKDEILSALTRIGERMDAMEDRDGE